MSLLFYKVLHVLALSVLLVVTGGVALHAANGGTRKENKLSGVVAALHGLALVVALISGFGMLAKLGVGLPGWVFVKLALWLLFGVLTLLPYRSPQLARPLFFVLPILGAIGTYFALYKPF